MALFGDDRGVEPDAVAQRLPTTYRQILSWLAEGCAEDEIARRLTIDPLAVGPLVRLAEAKLARVVDETRAATDGPATSD